MLHDINRGLAGQVIIGGTQNPNVVLANAGFIPQVRRQEVRDIYPDPLDERNALHYPVDTIDSVAIVPGSQPTPQNPPTLPGAIDSARKALEGDPCKSLFSKGNGLDKLNELVKKKRIKIGDAGVPKSLSPTGRLRDAPGLGEIEKGGKIFLNPSSGVMKGTYPYASPTAAFGGLSPTDALAALIIHGVLHVTKDIEPDGTSPNDSLIHNADVARNCFPKPNP